MENCKAQGKPNVDVKVHPNVLKDFTLYPGKTLTEMRNGLNQPAFIVGKYAFYPKLKKIGYAKTYVPPMSSSGIGTLYYAEIANADYDNFEIINADWDLAKDKITYYRQGEALNLKPNIHQEILIDNYTGYLRIVTADSTWVLGSGVNKFVKYYGYKKMSDIVYKKSDSLFIFHNGQMNYIKNPIFDASSLKQIDWKLYQDHKNVYYIDLWHHNKTI
ncbi:MAG TPA: hypothetical protein VF677_14725 [Flavobacterium sp.]